jgi:hypothetical protein
MTKKEDNLIPQAHILTLEEQSNGGKASGEARKKRKTIRDAINFVLNSDIKITQGTIYDRFKEMGIDASKYDIPTLMSLGVALGGMQGNATNLKTLMEGNNELIENGITADSPTLKIEVVDNSHLEKRLYDANKKE